jgi:glycosyltransferase involved in cell wall biosynthesis
MPAKMGGQKGIYLFLAYFCRYCSLTCYTTQNNIPEPGIGFSVRNILSNHKLRYINPVYFFMLKREFRKNEITHLVIEHPYYGWLGSMLKMFANIKLIVHSHNIESLRFRDTGKWWWRILWYYERFTHRRADKSLFISEEDRQYAIQHFGLNADNTEVITYGIEQARIPSKEEKREARQKISLAHGIDQNDIILLYNGTLNYPPNRKALDLILKEINPAVQQAANLRFTTVICGNELPGSYNNLADYKKQNIKYAGFVDNIRDYFLAADIFINPIDEGGGIKTKLVEALAANCTSVSFTKGAIGIPKNATGNKLFIISDGNTEDFAGAIDRAVETIEQDLPAAFFDHFYWDNIAKKAATFINR